MSLHAIPSTPCPPRTAHLRRRPRCWSAAIGGIGVLVLASCAQGTGDSEDPEFAADATVSGTVDVMGFGLGDEIGQVRFDRAVAELDGVDVQLAEGELDVQAFLSAAASGNPPDLVYANRDQIGTFASRGAVEPLGECIDSEGIDTGVFIEPALAQVTFADEVYGIPEFNSVQLTMANADLLEAAELSVDDVNGSDWDAMTTANEALMRAEGGQLSVIGVDSKLPEFLPLWVHAAGGELLSEDGRTAQIDTPEAQEALEFAVGIYDAQGGFAAVKTYRDAADFFGAGNQFASGTLGAMPMEHWYVNVLNEVSADAPMAFDTVRDSDGESLAYASGSAWAIPSGSENPQAACRYIRLMTETDAWLEAAQARVDARAEAGLVFTGLLTGNAEADEQIREEFVTDDLPAPWDDAVAATYEANDHTFTLPANPADAEFKTAWQDAVNRVLNGQQEIPDALAQGQEEAQAALDEAWASWDAEQ